MPEYTGPISIPPELMEKYYRRFVDFCQVLRLNGYNVVTHPDNRGLLRDWLERMGEDKEGWVHDTVPTLHFSLEMDKRDIQAIDVETGTILTLAEVVRAPTGFGRFRGMWVPMRDRSSPWAKGGT